MAGRGRRVTFQGAFSSKAKARIKERAVRGFIKRVKVRGSTRYVVIKEKGR